MSRAVAALAVLLLLASATWLLLSDPQIADPGVPKFSGPPLQRLEASAPVVGSFELFYVNNENPFVPYDQRVRERVVYDPRPRTPRPLQPLVKNPLPPVRPPAIVQEPVRKPLSLPKLGQTGANAPVCIGLVAVNGHESLTVRMPGDTVAQTVDIGAQLVGGWTLLGIEGGNLARFRDPQGAEQVYPIGEGDLAVAQQGASAAPTTPAAPPKLPPGVLPRLPGSQPGVAPAPPPGENRPRRQRPGGMNGPAQPPAELPPLIPVPKK